MTLQWERRKESRWWLEAPAAACTQIKVKAEQLTGMENHWMYQEWVGFRARWGRRGLDGEHGREDGALSAGILPTDNTQLKHLEGNPWVLRPPSPIWQIRIGNGHCWADRSMDWRTGQGGLNLWVGQRWWSLTNDGSSPRNTLYWLCDLPQVI